jgi:hypothetical protein
MHVTSISKLKAIMMLLISIVAAYGQSAQINGAISDLSKTGVDGASIVASNTETGFKRSAKSDGAGRYTLSLLPPGVYLITVRAKGFQTAARDNVTLVSEGHRRIDFSLERALGGNHR